MSIDWSEFSWEAFATLVTGIAAVAAAWWVARNQIEIQKRQTKLSENDLKIQLLEKRSACVDELRQISNAWNQNANLSNEERAKFLALLYKVELLYPKIVAKKIDEAISIFRKANYNHIRSNVYYNRGEIEKGDEYSKNASDFEDKFLVVLPLLIDELVKNTRIDAWE